MWASWAEKEWFWTKRWWKTVLARWATQIRTFKNFSDKLIKIELSLVFVFTMIHTSYELHFDRNSCILLQAWNMYGIPKAPFFVAVSWFLKQAHPRRHKTSLWLWALSSSWIQVLTFTHSANPDDVSSTKRHQKPLLYLIHHRSWASKNLPTNQLKTKSEQLSVACNYE